MCTHTEEVTRYDIVYYILKKKLLLVCVVEIHELAHSKSAKSTIHCNN